MKLSTISKVKTFGSIAVSTMLGYWLGTRYSLSLPQDQPDIQLRLISHSHEQLFHLSASAALIWIMLCIAVVGRTPWPASAKRALFMYAPFSFAYGFAAQFFGMAIAFTYGIGSAADQLRSYTIAVFAWLTLLIAIPVGLSFKGFLVKDEKLVKKVVAVPAIVLLALAFYERT